jgi:hypothetical protein
MKDLLLIVAHLLTTLARMLGPGGAKAIVADSLLMKQQLLIVNRSRQRAPNLTPVDRMLLGFWSLFLSAHGIQRAAVILRPSTLLNFHDILKKRKYRLLYTARSKGKPGPKGPSQELIDAIVEMKRRNSRFGCPRIAQEINKAFGLNIDKDVVRRVLEKHYRPGPDSGNGPSWLTFIGHLKDSLWSIDMFRCESILYYAANGCSSSWISLRVESSVLARTPVMSMVWPCSECSTQPFQPRVSRNISAQTMIRYSCITNGKPT